ncbi:cag [Carabus blaptoides fortunei]
MVETGDTALLPKKRKRVVLSVKDKNDIVQRLNNGESVSTLSREYNVGMSTIYDVKKNSTAIINYLLRDKGCERRKSMKKPANVHLETALLTWIAEKRQTGAPVTGSVLCEKALQLNKQLNGDPNFKASSGWLSNFKLRHKFKEGDRETTFRIADDTVGFHFLNDIQHVDLVKEPISVVVEQPEEQQITITPTSTEAVAAFDIGLRWLEKQQENRPLLLMLLQNLRDLAQTKMENNTVEQD